MADGWDASTIAQRMSGLEEHQGSAGHNLRCVREVSSSREQGGTGGEQWGYSHQPYASHLPDGILSAFPPETQQEAVRCLIIKAQPSGCTTAVTNTHFKASFMALRSFLH